MDGASILIVLSLAVLTVIFIAQPLVVPRRNAASCREDWLADVRAQLEQQLRLLEEIELDREMGKISPEEFAAERPAMVARAAALMRQADEMQASGAMGEEYQELEAEIEAEVARRRGRASFPAAPHCTQCGSPVQRGDHFCGCCGAPVPSLEVGA